MPRARAITLAAAVATAGFLSASAAQAAPEDATATATYGEAEVWLEAKEGERFERRLVYAATPDATPRVLDADFRARDPYSEARGSTDEVALGRDAGGRLTALAVGGGAIYATPVTGRPALRAIPATTRRDRTPSIFRGRIAFQREVGDTSSVHAGTLTARTARRVASESEAAHQLRSPAVGAGGSVAYITYVEGNAPKYFLDLATPGRAVRRIYRHVLGETQNGMLQVLGVSTDGRRLRVERTVEASTSSLAFSLPSGKRM